MQHDPERDADKGGAPSNPVGAARTGLERLRSAIERSPLHVEDKTIQITVSIGFELVAEGCLDPELAINRADEALYVAKNGGRNQVRRYQEQSLGQESVMADQGTQGPSDTTS